jgi:hypothetical protein
MKQRSTSAADPAQEDAPYLHLLRHVEYRPIFLMGDHRSGTSLLYSLLDASGCFNVVRAYHLMCYQRILADHRNNRAAEAKAALNEWLRAAGQEDRVIDAFRVSADTVEEYGFHICASSRPRLTARSLPAFDELCRKIQLTSQPEQPILLKNPWDWANFLRVRDLVPGAKFIFVHRNPLRVISSQINAMRALFAEESPYQARLADWYRRLHSSPWKLAATRWLLASDGNASLRITTRHVRRASQYFLDHHRMLDSNDYIEVRYEDLCSRADETIGAILGFLQLQGRRSVDYSSFISPRPAPLCTAVDKRKHELFAQLATYCTHCTYTKDEIIAAEPAG